MSVSKLIIFAGSFTSAKHKLETRGGSREPGNLSRAPLLSVLLE
jgi:hypothetical protein